MAFNSLVQTIQEGIAAGKIAAGDGTALALGVWALVHGVAMLLIDGALSKPPGEEVPPEQVLAMCQAILREGWRAR